jgi:hypothetical protein
MLENRPEDTIIIPVNNMDDIWHGKMDVINCGINAHVRCMDISTGSTVESFYLIFGRFYNNFSDYIAGNSIGGPATVEIF